MGPPSEFLAVPFGRLSREAPALFLHRGLAMPPMPLSARADCATVVLLALIGVVGYLLLVLL